MALLFIVLLPFLATVPLLLVRRRGEMRSLLAWTAAVPTATALALVVLQWRRVFAGGVVEWTRAWVPSLGLDVTLRLDGYAWVFACLVLGIGLLILLYARYYMSEEEDLPRFFASLMFFMGSMTGVVLAGNLILLVVFWELTSLSSFLLIGYWRHDEEARSGARRALLVTGLGGLALLGGVLLLGSIAGSFELSAVLAAAGTVQEIFQATTTNYYAADNTPLTPIVLVGRAYWTGHLPAWPLLNVSRQRSSTRLRKDGVTSVATARTGLGRREKTLN